MNTAIKIYFADNSTEDISKFANHFENNDNFEVVGKTNDARTALKALEDRQIDVLVMDIVLGGMDGFEFLQKAKEKMGKSLPKIIITSHLSHSGFVGKALSLGASYFMVKPIDLGALENRIQDTLNLESHTKPQENKALDEKISNIFLTVGIPAHIKGYQFLREAIKLAIETPEIVSSITKKLYPSIATKFAIFAVNANINNGCTWLYHIFG